MKLRRLAGYEIVSRVESHGGATTYEAVQVAMGRAVLLTVLPPAAARVARHRAAFERRLAAASRLRHENVVSAIDAGDVQGWRYFATERAAGTSLAGTLRHGPLPVARAVAIAHDVARALAYLDAEGLFHRDVSPDSIVVADGGPAKLSGAVLPKGVAPARPEHGPRHAPYVAPERFPAHGAAGTAGSDVRAGIYSLGCVLYHMLTGHAPFKAADAAVVRESHATRVPTDPRDLRHDVPPPLVEVLDRCLRKRAEHRYATAADLASDLEAVRAGRPVAKSPADGALWPPPQSSLLPRIRRR